MSVPQEKTAEAVAFVDTMNHDGQGVARLDGKIVFIDGALPQETVRFIYRRKGKDYDTGQATAILRPSPFRQDPPCPHFGRCGGCSLQHLDPYAQVAIKERLFEENLKKIAQLKAEEMLFPIYGPYYHYRHRARLSVRFLEKKNKLLLGFHEKASSFVLDMHTCKVLAEPVAHILDDLKHFLDGLAIKKKLPQIEVAVAENATVLVARLLEAPSEEDQQLFKAFANRHKIVWYFQPKGPDSVYPFYPAEVSRLFYTLPDFGLKLYFSPTDFTQVNFAVNRILVRLAIQLLDISPKDRIADLFCGLGNFSLAAAKQGAYVIGFEGSAVLVKRAKENARENHLDRSEFYSKDLTMPDPELLDFLSTVNKVVIDPPRTGAIEIIKALPDNIKTVVYISCNPATFARDASFLVNSQGFTLRKTGIINLFPHTNHVESIALLTR